MRQFRYYISEIMSLVLLASTLILVFTHTQFGFVDDAYISFRYADNLASHGELVFNAGERVEGITNLLWTLILAAQIAIFSLPIESFALFLSLGLIVFAAIRLWQLGSLLGSTHFLGALAGLSLVLNRRFIGATTNGLEAALYIALMANIIYYYCRNQLKRAFFCAGLLFLTRPEGLGLGLLLITVVFLEHRTFRQVGVGIAIIGGFVVAVTMFRMLYYGAPLPNSVIAKSVDVFCLDNLRRILHSAIPYIGRFVLLDVYLIILFIGGLFRLFRTRAFCDKSSCVLLFCVGGIIFSFVVAIRNGGDWMGYRLLLQYGILYAVLLILLLRDSVDRLVIALLIVTFPFMHTVGHIVKHPAFSFSGHPTEKFAFLAETTRRLSGVLNDSDTVSSEGLGYISYHLINTSFHDPFGLTDPYLARYGQPAITYGKYDFAYTIGTIQPSVMVWNHPTKHLKGVDQKLLANYETFRPLNPDSWQLNNAVMIRRDRLSDLSSAFSDWQKIENTTTWIGTE